MGKRLPNSVQIGAAIRKIRTAEQPKESIEALALRAGIDKGYLTEIELGQRENSRGKRCVSLLKPWTSASMGSSKWD